jgi:hypothetical protein
MRKYIILFFSGLLVLAACKRTPEGIIKPDEMASVLTDVHLADGSMINIPQIPDSIYKYGMGKYLDIFKKHHIDSAQFRKSYKYYTMHADELVSIYDVVLKKLTAKSDSINALIAKNNTAQSKSNPANGKMVPTGSTGAQPAGVPTPPSSPATTGATGNVAPLKPEMLEKLRQHRDSMLRKNLKNSHALPAK